MREPANRRMSTHESREDLSKSADSQIVIE